MIKKLNYSILVGILILFICNNIVAQQKQNRKRSSQVFVDVDGDGYNDNAPDHDGDGIPNGLDSDWTKGRGRKMNYIDADGDGINDLIQNNDQTEIQNENMHQNNSGKSIINNELDNQKGHQRGKGNK